MPSPFPGMDPFLEAPDVWSDLHGLLIAKCEELLQPQLRARGYYAKGNERIWLVDAGRPVYPDLSVKHVQPNPPRVAASAVLEADTPVRVQRWQVEVRETYLEIRDKRGHRLLTAIEILSPANKTAGDGRELYLRKQGELRAAGVNLVEVDLLRDGQHTVEVPIAVVEEVRPCDYLVNVVRFQTTEYELYPIRLQHRLPRIGVPLCAGERDAVLDLQAALELAYTAGPYPDCLDYRSAPVPTLNEEQDAWVNQVLVSAGFRTATIS